MPETTFRVKGFECTRCGEKWIPKNIKVKPITCPHCKSPYWNIPRKKKKE